MIEVILKSVFSFGTKLLLSMGTEAMIKWVFFKVADVVVKSTKTPHDDEFLLELKESYKNTPDKVQ